MEDFKVVCKVISQALRARGALEREVMIAHGSHNSQFATQCYTAKSDGRSLAKSADRGR